jgi:hypothetical protein
MALGAGRWSVICESLRDTMIVFGVRLTAGIIAVRLSAGFVCRLVVRTDGGRCSQLRGRGARDDPAGLAACILLVRRATRIDPLAAIHHE